MRAWAYLNIEDPLVAWLAYRGEVFSAVPGFPGALSLFAAGRLRDATHGRHLLAVEQELERRRHASHPHAASRLAGFYAFGSEDDARRAEQWGPQFRPDLLTELEVSEDSAVSAYDSEWISYELDNGAGPWMDQYLSGETRADAPLTELIVEGSATILNGPLRDRAGQIAAQEWPAATMPLELGRIGFALGFTLGRVTAALLENDRGLRLDYYLDFDANDAKFSEALSAALADPTFPRNAAWLQPLDADHLFAVPDLRSRGFWLPDDRSR